MLMTEAFLYLTLCVYNEARGESPEGQRAVVHVVLTRAEERNQSVKEVIYAPWQFSWTSDDLTDYPVTDADWRDFLTCAESVAAAIRERMDGETVDRANHFHAQYVSPTWAKDMKFIKKIGKHLFYRG